MPDWNRFVRRRMQRLTSAAREDVVAELAHHLEQTFEQACATGLTKRAAIRVTLQEVQGWNVLVAEIGSAKQEGPMNYRTKSLWIPALATFIGASLSLTLCQLFKLEPHIVWVGKVAFWFYWPWLATLPLFGALGAHLSQRAHGQTRSRLMAGLSPALIMLIVMLLVLPWGLALDGLHFLQLVSFGLGLLNWVVLPAIALSVGILPFLGESRVAEIGNGAKCAG